MKRSFLFFVFLLSTHFSAQASFAFRVRPKGSMPGSDAPATILAIVSALFALLISIGYVMHIIREKRKTKTSQRESPSFDQYWHEENMKAHVLQIVPLVKEAWKEKNPGLIDHLVTNGFTKRHQALAGGDQQVRMFYLQDQDIAVSQVSIIDVRTDHQKSKQQFTALVRGEIKDFPFYINDEDENNELHPVIPDTFEDLYIFKRSHSRWLLDEVVHDPESWQK